MKTHLSMLAVGLAFAALLGGAAVRQSNKEGTDAVQTGFLFKSMEVGGRKHQYIVYVPRAYAERPRADGDGWPFILFLHGSGESGTDGQRQMLIGLGRQIVDTAERWPFIVVLPQKPSSAHQWEDHFDAVSAMLDRTLAEYEIDESRQYLTGLSQGGHGTWMYNALMPGRFAAIAPVCGYAEQAQGGYGPDRKWNTDPKTDLASRIIAAAATVPVWAFHGEADTTVPPSQTTFLIDAIRARRGEDDENVRLTIYPGVGHASWTPAYAEEELAPWFLSHRRTE